MLRNPLIKAFKKQIEKTKRDGIDQQMLEQYFELIKQSIQDDIKDGYQETIARNLTLGIGFHAGDYPKHLILNGKKDGWKYITRHLLWQGHILQKLFHYKEVTPRTVGCIMGLSLLWNMTDLTQLSREYFQFLFEAEQDKYKQKEVHHLFMAILFDLYSHNEINMSLYAGLPNDIVYRRFLDNWNSPDEKVVSELLLEICDHHVYSSLDLKDKFSEILSLNFIPYEIRLIEKIRKRSGLSDIKIDHPLLQTPLAEIPEKAYEWDLSKDEVFQYLLQRE
ncbi:hypothetical protein [Sphingobacterium sp. UBA1498]|uniref:hypothetical protein n=1 Tax=Sphingobacterium sp. UBA1498 TaxID=1947481 RepID=UPI0025F11E2A|nr:hypothetical protein [Sphingobacterium sp. UBA1498]